MSLNWQLAYYAQSSRFNPQYCINQIMVQQMYNASTWDIGV